MSLFAMVKWTRALSIEHLQAPACSRTLRMASLTFALSNQSIRDFSQRKHVYAGGS